MRAFRGILIGVTAFAVILFAAVSNSAASPIPTNLSPANGATIYADQHGPPGFAEYGASVEPRFRCSPYNYEYEISPGWNQIGQVTSSQYQLEVSTSPATDSEGRLINSGNVYSGWEKVSDSANSECTVDTFGLYYRPGKYYWQVSVSEIRLLHDDTWNIGPIWSFTVAEPLSTYMTVSQASVYSKRAVRQRKRNARAIWVSCSRSSTRAFVCRTRFRVGTKQFSGKVSVWHVVQDGQVYWTGRWKYLHRIWY